MPTRSIPRPKDPASDVDSGVPTTYSVSADREVQCEDAVAMEADILITCLGCEPEPDGDLWDEIYALYCR